jgi:hypothetical protein
MMSVNSALLAGRYSSAVNPASAARLTIPGNDFACERHNIITAALNMDTTMVRRRPTRSASQPPSNAATSVPIPYAPIAIPAWAVL